MIYLYDNLHDNLYDNLHENLYYNLYDNLKFQSLRQQNLIDNINLKVKTCSNYRQDLNEKTVTMNEETPTGINYHVGLKMCSRCTPKMLRG